LFLPWGNATFLLAIITVLRLDCLGRRTPSDASRLKLAVIGAG
jgi:hypothetical protein